MMWECTPSRTERGEVPSPHRLCESIRAGRDRDMVRQYATVFGATAEDLEAGSVLAYRHIAALVCAHPSDVRSADANEPFAPTDFTDHLDLVSSGIAARLNAILLTYRLIGLRPRIELRDVHAQAELAVALSENPRGGSATEGLMQKLTSAAKSYFDPVTFRTEQVNE